MARKQATTRAGLHRIANALDALAGKVEGVRHGRSGVNDLASGLVDAKEIMAARQRDRALVAIDVARTHLDSARRAFKKAADAVRTHLKATE